MRTNLKITSKLERAIVAQALITFRYIGKPETRAKTFVYLSTLNGFVYDECFIDTETWTLKKIQYQKNVDNQIKTFTINF